MKEIVQAQKELYRSGGTLPEDFRRLQLEKLRKGVLKYQDEIGEALRRDLNKSGFVERFLELSLFYGLSSPLNSEMICIFPYF